MAYASAAGGKYGLGEQNEQGQRLLELCTINNLIIINTLFQQTTALKTKPPDHCTKNQIDYIIVPQVAKQCEKYAHLSCRHQLHVMSFKLRLEKNLQQKVVSGWT